MSIPIIYSLLLSPLQQFCSSQHCNLIYLPDESKLKNEQKRCKSLMCHDSGINFTLTDIQQNLWHIYIYTIYIQDIYFSEGFIKVGLVRTGCKVCIFKEKTTEMLYIAYEHIRYLLFNLLEYVMFQSLSHYAVTW